MGNTSANRAARTTSLGLIPTNPNVLQELLLVCRDGSTAAAMEKLQNCISADPSLITTENEAYPLYLAAAFVPMDQTVEVCTLLLDDGADINGVSGGWTALHAAVEREDVPLIRLLLSRGARATWQEGDEGECAFHHAAKKYKQKSLEAMIDAGIDINSRSNFDDTITFVILAGDEPERVELLKWAMEKGLDVHAPATDREGLTPLHKAAVNGLVEPIKILIEAGCDVNALSEGKTPAQMAVTDGRPTQYESIAECIRLLVEAGAEDPGPLPNVPEEDSIDGALSELERFRQLRESMESLTGRLTSERDSSVQLPRRVRKADLVEKVEKLEESLAVAESRVVQAEARITKLEQLINDMINLHPDGPEVESIEQDFYSRAAQ